MEQGVDSRDVVRMSTGVAVAYIPSMAGAYDLRASTAGCSAAAVTFAEASLVVVGAVTAYTAAGPDPPCPTSVVGGAGSIETRDLWQEQEIAVSPTNQQVVNHTFLRGMYEDGYFPDRLVDKGKAILLRLCERIEAERPSDLSALYVLTRAATEEFNALEDEFVEAGSEIETVAREVIAGDFWFVASAYGFAEADVEELVAARDW
jgi:hypothetical protein